MASYDIAYKITAKKEGGWVIDNGGWTYLGMSIKGHPNWDGWKDIKAFIAKNGFLRTNTFFPEPLHTKLKLSVYNYYKKFYWDNIYGDKIVIQEIANFCYDFALNSGSGILLMNRAVGARPTVRNFNEDTLKVINERPAFAYQAIYKARKDLYTYLTTSPKLKAANAKWKDGWFARLDSFPKNIDYLIKQPQAPLFFSPFWSV